MCGTAWQISVAGYSQFCAPRAWKIKAGVGKYILWNGGHIQPKTTGHDLKNSVLEPGPRYQNHPAKVKEFVAGRRSEAIQKEEKVLLEKILG